MADAYRENAAWQTHAMLLQTCWLFSKIKKEKQTLGYTWIEGLKRINQFELFLAYNRDYRTDFWKDNLKVRVKQELFEEDTHNLWDTYIKPRRKTMIDFRGEELLNKWHGKLKNKHLVPRNNWKFWSKNK